MFCGGFKIAAKKQKIPKIQNIMLASWNQDYGHSANFIHTFPFQLIHFPNALWVYPNVNGSVRNFSQNNPNAPISSYSIISEKIFGLKFQCSFTFFTYLWTSWQNTQNCTSNHAFYVPFPFRPQKFWGRVEQIFQNSPRRYLSSRRLKANIWIFQIAFSQWIAPLTKKSFSSLL